MRRRGLQHGLVPGEEAPHVLGGLAREILDVVSSAVADLTGKPAEDMQSFLTRHQAVLLAPPAH